MFIGSCIITLSAEWVQSLKEKRMVVKSIIEKCKHKFNISIAEVDMQDLHKNIVIGFACVSNEKNYIDKVLQRVIDYIEVITDAVIIGVEREIF